MSRPPGRTPVRVLATLALAITALGLYLVLDTAVKH